MAPDLTTTPSVQAIGSQTLSVSLSLSGPGIVRYAVVYSTLYAQAGDVLLSFASPDPALPLAVLPATSPSVIGTGGVLAAGSFTLARASTRYALQVVGGNSSTPASGSASPCSCSVDGTLCTCAQWAPCLGSMCSQGPSAITPSTTYKVGKPDTGHGSSGQQRVSHCLCCGVNLAPVERLALLIVLVEQRSN